MRLRKAKRVVYVATEKTIRFNYERRRVATEHITQDMINAVADPQDEGLTHGLYPRPFKHARKMIIEIKIYPAPKKPKTTRKGANDASTYCRFW